MFHLFVERVAHKGAVIPQEFVWDFNLAEIKQVFSVFLLHCSLKSIPLTGKFLLNHVACSMVWVALGIAVLKRIKPLMTLAFNLSHKIQVLYYIPTI